MDFLTTDPARWIFAAWFTVFGSAVGSFLNVVVYRVPNGLSIAWPPSHCPRCKRAIRWYDNVPVLSWLWLRAGCRDCGQPISARYPLVETLCGGLFLLLLAVEFFGEGRNLPMRVPPAAAQADGYSQAQTLALCVLHAGLLCTLLASSLMTLDGERPPLRLFLPMLAAGYVAPIIWPWLHPQAAGADSATSPWGGLIDGSVGLGFGYFVGRTAALLGRVTAGIGKPGYQIRGEAMLLGVVLGWQAVVVLVLLTIVLEELTRLASLAWPRLCRVTAAVWLPPLILLWLLRWAALAAAFPNV